MARKRMIDSSLHQNPKICKNLNFRQRWLYECLICPVVDDRGIGLADPEYIKSVAFIYDKVSVKTVAKDLIHFQEVRLICLYSVNGQAYFHFPSWNEWQNVQHPSPSHLPECPLKEHFTSDPHEIFGGLSRKAHERLTKTPEGIEKVAKVGRLTGAKKRKTEKVRQKTAEECQKRKKSEKTLQGLGGKVPIQQGQGENPPEGLTKSSPQISLVSLVKVSKDKDMASPKKEPPVPPKKSVPKKTNPDIKKFLDYAFDAYKAKFNKRLVIVGGRDGKIVKGLLETGREPFNLGELKALWNDFLDSDIRTKEGSVTHSIPAFKGFLQTVIEGGGTIDKKALRKARMIRVATEQGEGETRKDCFRRLLKAGLAKPGNFDPTGQTGVIALLKMWGIHKKQGD